LKREDTLVFKIEAGDLSHPYKIEKSDVGKFVDLFYVGAVLTQDVGKLLYVDDGFPVLVEEKKTA